MADNILQLATTTIPCMAKVLWPYLLEFLVPLEYTEAVPVLCKSLAIIADQLAEQEDDEYDLDYEVQVNLPKPVQMIARLFVLAGHPLERGRGMPFFRVAICDARCGQIECSFFEIFQEENGDN